MCVCGCVDVMLQADRMLSQDEYLIHPLTCLTVNASSVTLSADVRGWTHSY